MIFYLGTHITSWLRRTDVPLFISRTRLGLRRRLPRALGPWALDSGGFTELSRRGAWTVAPGAYVAEARRFRDEIGGLQWAAIQDWMCEPFILKKTGLSVEEHQARTIESYETLRALAPEMPWAPVLQGWTRADYLRHVEGYARRGHDLRRAPVVGVGSICRRQATREAAALLSELAGAGLRLHGFGLKLGAFRGGAHRHLSSADSLAWSYAARKRSGPCPESKAVCCNNCLHYALDFRRDALALVKAGPRQGELFDRVGMESAGARAGGVRRGG